MDRKKTGNWLKKYMAVFFNAPFVLLLLSVSISLYHEKRYFQMTPFIIGAIFLSLIIFFSLWRPKYKVAKKENLTIKRNIKNLNFTKSMRSDENTQIFASKDPIQIMAIKDALLSNNINCIVLNQNSERLMHYIPDLEMTIVVPCKDYENSLEIVEAILESTGENWDGSD